MAFDKHSWKPLDRSQDMEVPNTIITIIGFPYRRFYLLQGDYILRPVFPVDVVLWKPSVLVSIVSCSRGCSQIEMAMCHPAVGWALLFEITSVVLKKLSWVQELMPKH